MLEMDLMSHELVKLIQVDIRKKLGREIAERESLARSCARETSNHALKKPKNVLVGNILPENAK